MLLSEYPSRCAASATPLGLAALLAAGAAPQAMAAAVIFNGGTAANSSVALGVNDQGHLNFSDSFFSTTNAGATGLAFKFPDGTWRDATAPGCLCEGWGVAVTTAAGDRVSGGASVDSGGVFGLTSGTFGATPSSATSTLGLTGAPLEITHSYGVSLSPNVFQGNVSLTNNGDTTLTDVVYRRAMDWDVPPTEFSEFVTHQGVVANLESNGGNVRFASDNGFADTDPTVDAGWMNFETVNTDFVDNGPDDHGSVFDFAFGDLAPGETRNFNIFYGAFASEAEADAAIALLKPNLWSYGQSSGEYYDGETGDSDGGDIGVIDGGEGVLIGDLDGVEIGDLYGVEIASAASVAAAENLDGTPATFVFGFGGVGGVEPGDNSQNPVLPFVPAPGQFFFDNPESGRWFDPPFAEGFAYTLLDDPTAVFTEVATPPSFFGFGDLTLVVGSLSFTLEPEVVFDFFANGLTDVTSFEIRGIDPGLDVADPGFSTAFPTFLSFTGSPDLQMDYIEVSATTPRGDAPLPGTLLLLSFGLAGLAWARKRT